MPKTDTRLNIHSNKGRKIFSKWNKVVIFCDTYVEENDDNTGILPTRSQVYDYGCSINLPSDMLGAIIACFYHAGGDRITDDSLTEKEIDKVENRFFVSDPEHAIMHGKSLNN